MTTGWGIDPKTGSWCYADADGALRTGWLQKNGSWYLLGADHLMLTGWQQEGGFTYYLAKSAAPCRPSGPSSTEAWNWLGSSLAPSTRVGPGWATAGTTLTPRRTARAVTDGVAQVDGIWYAFDASGRMASSGWVLTGGSWYLAEGSGALKTGWQRVNGAWYYLDPIDAKMATGDVAVGGNSYYLDDAGAMVASAWVRDATGVWRWYGADGALASAIDGLKATFADGSVRSGLTQLGNTWYLLDANVIQTGEQVVDGKVHLFDEKTGEAVTGWQKLN